MPKFNSILGAIGNTPHIKINRLFPANRNVYVKLEKSNPGGSIKVGGPAMMIMMIIIAIMIMMMNENHNSYRGLFLIWS
jgi:hypothetical protein